MSHLMYNVYPAGDESESSDECDVGRLDTSSHTTDVGDAVAQELLMKRAIDKGDIVTVQQLLDNGLDVDTRLRFEWTPLMCAVSVANYDLAKLLLDRGASANFRKDHWTVLMASCMASATEDKIARCVELLLSRSADPNMVDRSQITCLMLAARNGHSKVINLLVSHGAAINVQDANGYTALCIAMEYDREEAVLELLQLGADQTIRTKAGKSPTDVAVHKHTQVILPSSSHSSALHASFSTEETLSRFFMTNSAPPSSNESVTKLDDLELLMHALGLGHLADIAENDITWSRLLTMEEMEDLQKVGITDPEDQQKLLSAVQQMHLDQVDLDLISFPSQAESGSEELHNFLISVRHECCYLTEEIQAVIRQFACHASQLALSPDPKGEALEALEAQTKDLQKEVTCLRNLLCQADETADPCLPPRPASRGNRRFRLTVALSALGAASLLLLYRAARGGAGQSFPWRG
ncbi:ankyrin repeat, SAM and basic leucine zipper domain-containing protein 1 isoform X2 [Gasterosteus aculeatus]